MRLFLTTLLVLFVGLYVAAAFYFYQQESWARVPVQVGNVSAERLRHPNAILGTVRDAIDSGKLSNPVEPYILRSLSEAPASYQSPFLLAAFLANRLEDPERTDRAFDAAIRLFPANGRLHLSYAQWLLPPKTGAARWRSEGAVPDESEAYRERALGHLRMAAQLQADLAPTTLKWLAWSGVPSSKWEEFVPETLSARADLAWALEASGYRTEAVEVLSSTMRSTTDERFLYKAAQWAFDWDAPEVALEVGTRWLEEDREGRTGIQFARAALLVARAHLAQGKPKLAYAVFEDALVTIEADTEVSSAAKLELLAGMAHLYSKADQPLMAQSLFLEATKLAPHDANVWLALARAYRKAGNETLSIRSYREVLRLQPKNLQAERELRPLLLESQHLTGGA